MPSKSCAKSSLRISEKRLRVPKYGKIIAATVAPVSAPTAPSCNTKRRENGRWRANSSTIMTAAIGSMNIA